MTTSSAIRYIFRDKNVHLIREADRWVVHRENGSYMESWRADPNSRDYMSNFALANAYALAIAETEKVACVVHGRMGKIEAYKDFA